MKGVMIKDLKKGEYFVLTPDIIINTEFPVNESRVFVRGNYDRELKRYSCTKFVDFNSERFFKGDRIVYTDFIF